MRYRNLRVDKKGFTIIELLIAIIIIGILVAVIIPVLLNRAEEARIAAAESDIEHLRGAEERSAIDTGYAYRFHVLDDKIGGNGIFDPLDPGDLDGIRDERANTLVFRPTHIFIGIKSGDFLGQSAIDPNNNDIFDRLVTNETSFGWNGPYVNYHRFRDVDYNDIPEDPWGEEYLLFTGEGLVDHVNGIILRETSFVALDTGAVTSIFYPFFDRFTILSKGPNGLPGDGSSGALFGTDDDIYQQF